MLKKILCIFVGMLLAACSSTPGVLKNSAIPVILNQGLPAPAQVDFAGGVRPYTIGPYDTLSIDVFGIEELTREDIQTDAGGNLSFPLLGTIEAAGRTPRELAQLIERGLRNRYVRDPHVSVNLKETVSQVFTIDGQVTKPGLYPILGNMTLMRAVATAEGLDEFADLQDVVLFRTVRGKKMAGLYNLAAIRAGAYEDPAVYPNDVIVVGDSSSRRIFRDILQSAPLLTTPLLILFGNR